MSELENSEETVHARIIAGKQVSFNPSEEASARTIDAAWIREAALNHTKVHILGAVIKGALDLRFAVIAEEFMLDNCSFQQHADFYYATFKREFHVSGTAFNGGASFQGVTFDYVATLVSDTFSAYDLTFADMHALASFNIEHSNFFSHSAITVFDGARFDRQAYFGGASFGSRAQFLDAQFDGVADFEATQFSEDVSFARAHFYGLADFGPLRAKKASFTKFTKQADFYGAHFDGNMTFVGTTFGGDVDFRATRINGDAMFTGASFLGKATFLGSRIDGIATFLAAKPLPAAIFRKEADFRFIKIAGPTDFGGGAEFGKGAEFDGKAMFDGAEFRAVAAFQGAEFNATAQFIDAQFGGDLYFIGTEFKGDAAFNRAQIAGIALFIPRPGVPRTRFSQNARFTHKASFLGAQFASEVQFGGVRFEDKADFSGARFGSIAFFSHDPEREETDSAAGAVFNEVKFEHALFQSDAHFDDVIFRGPASFKSAKFGFVYFAPTGKVGGSEQFLKDIDLTGCTYDRIETDWQSLLRYPSGQSRLRYYDRQPFMELTTALRKSGLVDQAEGVYLEQRSLEHKKLSGLAVWADSLYWHGANYGTSLRPEFFMMSILLIFGIVVFTWPGMVKARAGFGICEKTKIINGILRASFLSIYLFLPFELPVKPRLEPEGWFATSYANFLRICGWILIPLGVAVLSSFLYRAR